MQPGLASLLVILVIWGSVVDVLSSDYCQIAPDHTMCQFPGVGSACGPSSTTKSGISSKEKDAALWAHNHYRAIVANAKEKRSKNGGGPQPAAANVLEMVWNSELAKIAQRWADQCTFAHDKKRDTSKYRVGQNVHISKNSRVVEANWTDIVHEWYVEVVDFPASGAEAFPGKMTPQVGHYTQLLWATSHDLGCGMTVYKSGSLNAILSVCDYGPAGNIKNKPIYKVGKACSACPDEFQKCSSHFPGLCSSGKEKAIGGGSTGGGGAGQGHGGGGQGHGGGRGHVGGGGGQGHGGGRGHVGGGGRWHGGGGHHHTKKQHHTNKKHHHTGTHKKHHKDHEGDEDDKTHHHGHHKNATTSRAASTMMKPKVMLPCLLSIIVLNRIYSHY